MEYGHDLSTTYSNTLFPPQTPQLGSRSPSSPSMRGAPKGQIMAKYLYSRCHRQKWFVRSGDEAALSDLEDPSLGVVLKGADGVFATEPKTLDPAIIRALERLGAPVAITMSSEIVSGLADQITPFLSEISLGYSGPNIPIVKSVSDISSAQSTVSKDSFMCYCRAEQFLLVWNSNAQGILAHCSDIESRIVGFIWGTPIAPVQPTYSPMVPQSRPRTATSTHSDSKTLTAQVIPYSVSNLGLGIDASVLDEKIGVIRTALEKEELGDRAFDPEKEGQEAPKRPFLLSHATLVGFAMVLCVVVEMACVAKMITEVQLDGNMVRFALLVTVPLFASFSLFFMIVISGSLCQIFGPLSNLRGNSRNYSAIAPKAARYPDYELPHVTIQMPVYKEGLKGVIIPTVMSLLKAVKYYEELGGTASIYVNDDGMQLVDENLAEARKAFYELNGIGWCARPGHCTEEGEKYFLRKGQFKKASNMNYCLDFSIRVEDEYLRLVDEACRERQCTSEDITIDEEDELYAEARNRIIENDGGKTWADGDVRIGEVILIIDSDTRVPEDCLLYGALEMHESPEVAIIQHASGILQVVNNSFENGITYFTNLVYTSIQFAVGNGDCGPFVGHNAMLRWKAIQSVSFQEDGMTKFWSDSHVSEDFDVSLRLQMADFVVRLATYHNGGFKEGVSLTVYDELARWEKYAYGCNELVFHPLYKWLYKGPITPLFRKFLFSKIKITSKITILGYIGTYYAVASAIPLSLINYFMVGWFQSDLDQFYLTSWKVFVGMAVVFNLLSPLGYAMLRHRLGQATFFGSLWETIKWTPMFLLFFGGISFHLSKALCCHFLSIKMEWTTTAKELEASGFRVGLDRIVRDFKYMYLVLALLIGAMVYLACFAPYGYTITDFSAIVPLANQVGCHALLPFALGLF